MLVPVRTSRFKRDYKRIIKQGQAISELDNVLLALIKQEKLAPKHRDHQLTGDLKDFRECHVAPDWLLIYKIEAGKIYFTRTGSHAELFSK